MAEREHLVPHHYQEYCAIRCAIRRGAAVFARPGLGKTIIALRAIQIIKPKKVLIVAPLLPIQTTWPNEIDKWDMFSDLSYNILRKGYPFNENNLIDLINFEQLDKVNPKKYELVVFDESSFLKNIRSARNKNARRIARYAKYRIVLTGTPIPLSYLDIFSQIYLADLGATLGKKFYAYRNKYFLAVTKRFGVDKIFTEYTIRKGAEKEINLAISPTAISLDTKGLIEMPELSIIDKYVQLNKEQYAKYMQMEKELFTDIKGLESFAYSAASSYIKCHQLANGALYKEDKKSFVELHNHKIEALKSLVSELGGRPLLVGYQFDHDKQRILNAFPHAKLIDSKIISAWNRGKIPILLAQYQSAAYGLNLQGRGNDICLFSLTDNWANYDQLICRVYRQGVKNNVFVHRLIARNTVDEVIAQRLDRKQARNDGLLEALRAYRWLKSVGK